MTEDIPGGVYAFAAVVDHFQRRRLNPIVGQKSKNPQLREWHTKNAAHKNEVTAATSKRKARLKRLFSVQGDEVIDVGYRHMRLPMRPSAEVKLRRVLATLH